MPDPNNDNDWLSLLPDNGDEDDNTATSAAIQRQERIRRAFEISKESYKTELVTLSPSFFRLGPTDVIHVANNDRFGLQNLGMPRDA